MGADGVPGVLVRCKWVTPAGVPLGTENTGRGTDTGGDEIVGAATVGAVPNVERPPRREVVGAVVINGAKGFGGGVAVDVRLVVAKFKVGVVERDGKVVVGVGFPKVPKPPSVKELAGAVAEVVEVENMLGVVWAVRLGVDENRGAAAVTPKGEGVVDVEAEEKKDWKDGVVVVGCVAAPKGEEVVVDGKMEVVAGAVDVEKG